MQRLHHQGGDMATKGKVDVLATCRAMTRSGCTSSISNHARYTGSARAKHILDELGRVSPKFVKVMPVEYRRALRDMEQQQAAAQRRGTAKQAAE
jgi:glutamate synthase (NADPH/NADH) large chain